MIRDYQAIQRTWFAIGQQRIIQTYGKHEGVKLVGILNADIFDDMIHSLHFYQGIIKFTAPYL